ncbi:hypothetical protein PsYK624_137970 [Phanerochaete sordida]|uniref:Uncharacterized protein n=1 Tax=Phanerochaete sordida TaxID=48140 RepID=A0A9P3GMP5_9APHY|nr:hypothetical protein PsYK624_137970 [Phanerochaete sordida]
MILLHALQLNIATSDPLAFPLQVASPHAAPILSYVRHLTLKTPVDPSSAPRVIFVQKVADIVAAFPRLKTLTLGHMYLRVEHLKQPIFCRDLDRLSLVDVCSGSTADSVIGTLSSLYNMRKVRMTNINFSSSSVSPSRSVPANLTHVHTLTVRSHVFTASIVDFFVRGSLRKLGVRCSSVLDTRALGSFLTSCDSSLEHLSLEFNARRRPPPSLGDLPQQLRQCNSLTALSLRITLASQWRATAAALRVVSQLVSGLPVGVRTLAIAVAVDASANFNAAFCRGFAAALAQELASLDEIGGDLAVMRVCWLWTTPRGQDVVLCEALKKQLSHVVRAQYPALVRKGMLFFSKDDVRH